MKAMVISMTNFENYVHGYLTATEVRRTAFLARLPEPVDKGDTLIESSAKEKYDDNYDRIFGPK